ncbi:MAG: carbohydrate kinase family protein [Kiritimatiellia bacterium]|jgi:sugar/nucleoside kinase (ribokinase family)|nr:carbohydrate kinase family protein [Kiritimatiellia bacterium]
MRSGIIGTGNWIVDKVKMIDRWPGEGELCNILGQESGWGGGPCNVLFDLAALGVDIPLYAAGVLGKDVEGEALMEQIRARGIDDRSMSFSDSASTSFTDVMTVQGSGRRTFFHNRGANAELDYPHLAPIDVPAKLFYLGYLLLLDAMDRPDPAHGTVAARVLEEMRAKGYRTVVDVVTEDPSRFRDSVLPALGQIDCLVVNEVEAGCCSGREVRKVDGTVDGEALVASARSLLEEGVQELVVIHCPEGAIALEKNGALHAVPSCRIEDDAIVGSVGAGDAFCAGVLYGLHEDLPLDDTLRLGVAGAWFNLQSATASGGAPTLEQLTAHLESCTFNTMAWQEQ